MISSEKFNLNDPHWLRQESKEVGGMKPGPIVGFASIFVHCKRCGHIWRAETYGEGQLRPTVYGAIVKCPECSESEEILMKLFNPQS